MKLFHANLCCGKVSLTKGTTIIAWLGIISNVIALIRILILLIRMTPEACITNYEMIEKFCDSVGLLLGMAFLGFCGVIGFEIFISALVLIGLKQNRYLFFLPWIFLHCMSLVALISFYPFMITALSVLEAWSYLVVFLLFVTPFIFLLYHCIAVVYTIMVQIAGPAWGNNDSSHGGASVSKDMIEEV